MLTGPAATIVTVAFALCEGSARLTAVTVTGFELGTLAGAAKSIDPPAGPVGGAHGFDPEMQIRPIVAFPSGVPSTNHDTAASSDPETFAASEMRCDVTTVADGGDIFTFTVLAIVTEAEAWPAPDVTALAVAAIVTGSLAGKSAGAEYRAELVPVAAIVP